MSAVLRLPLSDWIGLAVWLTGSALALYAEWLLPAIGGGR